MFAFQIYVFVANAKRRIEKFEPLKLKIWRTKIRNFALSTATLPTTSAPLLPDRCRMPVKKNTFLSAQPGGNRVVS